MNAKEDFVQLCRLFSACTKRSQGAGGNISVKENTSLWIKASGYRLSSVTNDSGYAQCDLSVVQESYEKNIESLEGPLGGKPSMETFFHLLPPTHIVHIHPTFFCNYLCSTESRNIFTKEHFQTSMYVPYIKPGLPLAKYILPRYTNETVIFLENHGIILLSDSVESILSLYESTLHKLEERVGIPVNQSSLSIEYKLSKLFNQVVKPVYNLSILPTSFLPVTPDHFLFLQLTPFLTTMETVDQDSYQWLQVGTPPSIVQVDRQVYCLASTYDLCTNKEEYLRSYLELDSANTALTEQDQTNLLDCPKEKLRLNSQYNSNLAMKQVQ